MKDVVHPLKDILNRLRWTDTEKTEDYLITYVHRGAPGDRKTLRASKITRLGKSYFTFQESDASGETLIPFHRVVEVRKTTDGSIIWVSRKHPL